MMETTETDVKLSSCSKRNEQFLRVKAATLLLVDIKATVAHFERALRRIIKGL